MKNLLFIPLIMLGLSTTSCLVSEEDMDYPTNLLKEPEISTSGKGHFSCRVNGELFIGDEFFTAWYNENTLPKIFFEHPNGMIQFLSSQEFKGVRRNVILLAQPIEGSEDYEIIDYHPGPPYEMYSSYDDHEIEGIYWLDQRFPGTITILRNDEEVIAGTFECHFQNKYGDQVKITHGRFDLKK